MINGDKEFKLQLGDKAVVVKTGVAEQAHGSALVQIGETSVLAASTMSDNKMDTDFFPLTVEYQEKFYAAGKILGSRYTRREGRPSNKAILTSRVIDRSIRPLFPENFRQETQVILTSFSWDGENSPTFASALGASISLGISKIPWEGPTATVEIGKLGENFILNPTYEQKEKCSLKIIYTGLERNGDILVNMIEAQGEEALEEDMLKAYDFAKPYLKQLIDFQKQIIKEAGKPKIGFEDLPLTKELETEIREIIGNRLLMALSEFKNEEQSAKIAEIKTETLEKLKISHPDLNAAKLTNIFFEKELEILMHKLIIEKGWRPDGRGLDELRPLTAQVAVLPRTHGSGFFARGKTQALSILTLGAPGDQQMLEEMDFQGKKRYMHHYNFPPYCSGEVKRLGGGPGRREIGHGSLAENALLPLVPDFESFPYTIRIVTEIISSNGSTSMASVCGSTLALMDAGVPIKKPAAGISIGLAHAKKLDPKSNDYKLLVDIQGPEDHYCDMDFKVAGTDQGITAVQLDVKLDGLTRDIMENTYKKAKEARLQILKIIAQTIPAPREHLSPYAPIIVITKISPDKIGELIGPKGKNINEIIDKYGVQIDIEDDGTVSITAKDRATIEEVLHIVKGIGRVFEVGEIVDGTVVKIMEFGAFVELTPSIDGLIHISQLANKRVNKVEDVVKEGDKVKVKIIKVDPDNGKISLSLKDTLQK